MNPVIASIGNLINTNFDSNFVTQHFDKVLILYNLATV